MRFEGLGDVVGAICISVSVLLAIAAVLAWIEGRRLLSAAKEPRRMLTVITYGALPSAPRAIGVSGTVVSPPNLEGPLTQRPCVAWHLSLLRDDATADASCETEIWTGNEVGDLQIAYDLRFETDGHQPLPERPEFPRQPGTVDIPGDRTSLSRSPQPKGVHLARMDAATLPRLTGWGVPDDLRSEVTAEPNRYRLREESVTTGVEVQCHQSGPDTRFKMVELNMEELRANMAGCLVPLLLAGALVLLILGLGFIND